MRTKRAVVAAIALATALSAGLAGCGGGDGDGGGEVVAEAPAPPADPIGDWLSTSVTEAGKPRKMPPGLRVSLNFTGDGRVSASAGCNTSGGKVSFADGRVRVSDMATTAIGCPGPAADQDAWLNTFLGSSPAYTYGGESLELTDGTTHLRFAPRAVVEPDLPVAGPRWRITHVTTGPPPGSDGGAAAGAAPAHGQLVFSGGRVTGSAGCARFAGPADVGEASIEFGPLTIDRAGCGAGMPGAAVEEALAVLTGAVAYDAGHRTLTLTHPSGKGLQLESAQTAARAGPS